MSVPIVRAAPFAAALLLGACTQRASIQFMTMPPGADADLTITGDAPPLPRAMVEVRNIGEAPADITIAEAEGWGPTPTPTIAGPTLPIPPGGTWQTHIDQSALLRFHNRGRGAAKLQLFTPAWTSLTLTLYPRGREEPARTSIVHEPGADGVYREPPVRPNQ